MNLKRLPFLLLGVLVATGSIAEAPKRSSLSGLDIGLSFNDTRQWFAVNYPDCTPDISHYVADENGRSPVAGLEINPFDVDDRDNDCRVKQLRHGKADSWTASFVHETVMPSSPSYELTLTRELQTSAVAFDAVTLTKLRDQLIDTFGKPTFVGETPLQKKMLKSDIDFQKQIP